MIKRLLSELSALGWTLGGTGLVLITLSGDTMRWGIYISIASLAVHLAGVIFNHLTEEDAE